MFENWKVVDQDKLVTVKIQRDKWQIMRRQLFSEQFVHLTGPPELTIKNYLIPANSRPPPPPPPRLPRFIEDMLSQV